jgi:hypothetical protein
MLRQKHKKFSCAGNIKKAFPDSTHAGHSGNRIRSFSLGVRWPEQAAETERSSGRGCYTTR